MLGFFIKEELGRQIDKGFIKGLKILEWVNLCGRRREYHTFVYPRPIFKKPLEFIPREILKDKHWILKIELETKYQELSPVRR